MRLGMGGCFRMSDEKTLCARCGHECRWHTNPEQAGGRCEEACKDGHTCRCPKFADPARVLAPVEPIRGR